MKVVVEFWRGLMSAPRLCGHALHMLLLLSLSSRSGGSRTAVLLLFLKGVAARVCRSFCSLDALPSAIVLTCYLRSRHNELHSIS